MALRAAAVRPAVWLLAAAIVVATAFVDLPGRAERQFWGDGATYYAMAWSLAVDGDLEYGPQDVARVRREFPSGPQGIFLKRASGGFVFGDWGLQRLEPDERRIYFAKSFVYPLFAAPLVWLFGTAGLMMANGLALALALVLGFELARDRLDPGAAAAWVGCLFLATITPLYLVWPAPEMLNVGLIVAALWAWRRERPVLSAVLFGIATYSKPTNLFLSLPLGVAPLLPRDARSFARRFGESLRRGAVLAGVVLAGYGANMFVTGEINYQGGERKTFYDRFPDETADVTFGNSGFWMTTNQVGPLVAGRDEDKVGQGSGPPLAAEELDAAFIANLGYFWVGRYGGVLAYYFPVALALSLLLAIGPRDRDAWLALASLVVSYIFYIWLIPANWYGGGGTVGNRYFLNLVPLGLFLLPRRRGIWVSAVGAIVSLSLVTPALAAPFRYSTQPGRLARHEPFRVFPIELTMLNDLSFCTEKWRCRRPVGDTEGDPWRHWPADPRAYWLYFPDDGTVAGLERIGGETGFRIRPGAHAQVVVRALEPVREVTVTARAGPGGDVLDVALSGQRRELAVAAGGSASTTVTVDPGFLYYDSFLHVVSFASRAPSEGAEAADYGSFVTIAIETDKRPPTR